MQKSGFRLFRIFGIDVYLHWAWIVVALIELRVRRNEYSSIYWNAAEYLSLFGIVLLHEMGHALACRSVGGTADRILLWPLGGVAFIRPPQRPGALLWSIVAGPLVNVVLAPLTFAAYYVARENLDLSDDAMRFLYALLQLNAILLVFNLIPAYPLDGGQILRALLWFAIGPANSLFIAAVVGIVGAIGLLGLAIAWKGIFLGCLAVFMGWQSWMGLKQALLIRRMKRSARHRFARCPECGTSPPIGAFWKCQCGNRFDTFASAAQCPQCGIMFHQTACTDCGKISPRFQWHPIPPPPVGAGFAPPPPYAAVGHGTG